MTVSYLIDEAASGESMTSEFVEAKVLIYAAHLQ